MFICILGIHRLARWLGVELEQRALLLCAVLAMAINFAALNISSALTKSHYILLTVLVLSSAAFVTYCQENYFRRALTSAGNTIADNTPDEADYNEPSFEAEMLAAETNVGNIANNVSDNEPPPYYEETASSADYVETLSAEEPVVEAYEEAPVLEAYEKAPEPEEESNLLDEISSRFESELAIRHEAITDKLAGAAADPFFGIITSDSDSDEDAFEAEPEEVMATIHEEPETTFETEIVETIEPAEAIFDSEAPATEIPEEETLVEEAPADISEEPVVDTDTIDKLATLDDYLDYIFEQKQLDNQANTLYACSQALDKYADDDYAPFIVIDMANIFKSNGAYEKAADVYRQAFDLKSVRGSTGMYEEFKKSLTYIEAVKYILSQHDAPKTPFKEIPSEILSEIEQEYSSRLKTVS